MGPIKLMGLEQLTNSTKMKRISFAIALSLIAIISFAQNNDVTSFYAKNTVLNFNDGNTAGEM